MLKEQILEMAESGVDEREIVSRVQQETGLTELGASELVATALGRGHDTISGAEARRLTEPRRSPAR